MAITELDEPRAPSVRPAAGRADDRDTERVTCDRCSTTVPLTRAITHGSVEDPDEVVCAECIKSADRVI